MLARALATGLAVCLSLAAAPKQTVAVVTTQLVNFAPGGAIRITGSLGELNVEGWDRPEVQIQFTRTLYRDDAPAARDRAKKDLEAVKLTTDSSAAGRLVIATVYPKRSFPGSLVSKCEIELDYRILVPRNSKLEIEHGMGDITIYDIAGDIQAHIRSGDIVAQLPADGVYNIDAKTGLGTVYTDFGGKWRAPFLLGHRFAGTSAGPARQISFRAGVGGISIVKMSGVAAASTPTP